MTNLDVYMEALREQMQERYFAGDHNEALALSLRLDKLIALKQRERECGTMIVSTHQPISPKG